MDGIQEIIEMTINFSFNTFEKWGIFWEGVLVAVISVAKSLKMKHGPAFLTFLLFFKSQTNFPRNL